MIILDTHIWLWWVHGDPMLSPKLAEIIAKHEKTGLGISAISCWEVAKLVEYQRITLPHPIQAWMRLATAYPGVTVLNISPEIAIESTQLPPSFHKDPADQLIVATARIYDVPLMTCDQKILAYPHVRVLTA